MDYKKAPSFLKKFINYRIAVKNSSPLTVNEYCYEICKFFEYLLVQKNICKEGKADLEAVDHSLVSSVKTEDIYEYLVYTAIDKKNMSATRARKLSSLKAYFRYLNVTEKSIDENPAKDIDSPKIQKKLPAFMNLDESIELLESVKANPTKDSVRNYAILSIFLNCGLRVAELVGLDIKDIDLKERTIQVTGKGNKQRIIYLNDSVTDAVERYLKERVFLECSDKDALFVSRNRRRISIKTVQWIVYKQLDAAGLGGKNLSVHKLRHTAATLMYGTGKVDIGILKDILGHESLGTTQIYAHVSNAQKKMAVDSNPLANIKNTGKAEE